MNRNIKEKYNPHPFGSKSQIRPCFYPRPKNKNDKKENKMEDKTFTVTCNLCGSTDVMLITEVMQFVQCNNCGEYTELSELFDPCLTV